MKTLWMGIMGLSGMMPAAASAAELYVMGYAGATNTVFEQKSSTGSVSVDAERVAETFANNRIYRDVSVISAYAAYGVNKAFGSASSQNQLVSSSGYSRRSDNFIVTSNVTSGFIRAMFDISYDLDATPYSQATASYTFTAGQRGLQDYATLNASGYDLTLIGAETVNHITQGADSRRQVSFLIPFTSGQSLFIASTLGCSVTVGRTGSEIASCDAGHSAYWGGIVNLIDQSGNIITNWSLTSQSGTDYRQSFVPTVVVPTVPEPATWAMMIIGFGAVGSSLRRRRPQTQALAA